MIILMILNVRFPFLKLFRTFLLYDFFCLLYFIYKPSCDKGKKTLMEPRKGHFFSNIYQKRNRNKKNKKGNQNNNITFKRLLIFPFQYIAEKKLKQEYWKRNQNKNISFYRLLGSNWLIFSPMGGQEYIDISRYYVDKSRFLS